MPLPASYSESNLIGFIEAELGPLVAQLGLDASDGILEAVYEVEALLGHAVAAETDVVKLRALARWQGWLAALNAATNQFDVSLTGGKRFVRSQLWEHIQSRLAQAEASAMVYDEAQAVLAGGSAAYVTSIPSSPPYGWLTDEWA